jgi:pimeloyl-ACP methyl ester carboxylesterase
LLVVLPGLNDAFQDPAAGHRKWRWFYRDLAADRTILMIGRRRPLADGATTADMAADYARALESIARDPRLIQGAAPPEAPPDAGPDSVAPPFDVMGLSMGGLIAQHLAANHPHLVGRLILGITAHRNGPQACRWLEQWKDLARAEDWRTLMAEMARRNYVGNRAEIYAGLSETMPRARIARPDDPHDVLVSLDACIHHNGRDLLPRILAPTLVLAGDRDQHFAEPLIRETAAGIPNARLVLIPAAGHAATEEHKTEFEGAVREFLD